MEQKINNLSAVVTKSINDIKRDVEALKERNIRYPISQENELIASLRRENQELKGENKALRDAVTNLSLTTSDLNTNDKENENERLSLITAIRLLQTDPRSDILQHGWQQYQRKAQLTRDTNELGKSVGNQESGIPTTNQFAALSDMHKCGDEATSEQCTPDDLSLLNDRGRQRNSKDRRRDGGLKDTRNSRFSKTSRLDSSNQLSYWATQ